MDGKSHLMIGASIGAVCAIYFSPAQTINHLIEFVIVGGISGLAADLDSPSMLTSKLRKAVKYIYSYALIAGIALTAFIAYLLATHESVHYVYYLISTWLIFTGIMKRKSYVHNIVVSSIGIILLMYSIPYYHLWFIGVSIFIIIAPWCKHRGLTHTIWLIPLWGFIGYDLENHLGIEGLGVVAALGYASHLIADTITPAGVRWLYPFSNKAFKFRNTNVRNTKGAALK